MRAFLIFLIFYGAFSLWAQVHSFFSVDFQNDFLDCGGHGTDRYYTAGNSLTYSKFQSSRHQVLSFSVAQRAFTPSDLQDTTVVNFDYPYAGLLYLGGGYQWALADSSLFFVAAASLGTTGKYSGVAGMQKTLHQLFKDEMPRGWNTMSELGFFYQSRIGLAKRIINSRNNTLLLTKSLEWGSIYKKVILGFHGSRGSVPAFTFDRISVLTSSPLVGTSKRIFKRLSYYIYPSVTWIISNTILEKGFFSTPSRLSNYSSSNIIRSAVIDLECGITFDGGPLVLLYRQNWQTAETQVSDPHHFGAITVIYKFSQRKR